MTQFARPDSDDLTGGWSPSGVATFLWEVIDEAIADDGDAAASQSSSNGTTRTFRVGLTDVIDPQASTDHTVRIRARHNAALQGSNITVRVKQGTTVVATPIFQQSLTNSYQTFSSTLSGVQADSITDYTNLLLEISWTKDTGLGSTEGLVSWLVFEVPDAPVLTARPAALLIGL